MFPVIEGVIARRILLNFCADPEAAPAIVPPPLEVQQVRGRAIVGVCLIRLERIRPKGLPGFVGISPENMAHRIAIRFDQDGRKDDGVFIPRRDTDSAFVGLLGGRLLPGYHHLADFDVEESADGLAMDVKTRDGALDTHLRARWTGEWPDAIAFDHALVMRAVPHKWHELRHVPELVGDFLPESGGSGGGP
jgi:uncharacterized protein YqjF (DUF2071 family)